ncbi:MAG: hypothetical protein ACXU9D_12945 [Xanthobacteraceae bacterium]
MKGFVVIESETELDVVAVYTAAGRDGRVETLHTERVPARSRKAGAREVCVTFEPPLTVGTQYGTPAGQHSGDVIFTSKASWCRCTTSRSPAVAARSTWPGSSPCRC